MADNQEYEAVLAIEDDQNTVSNKGTGKGSEQEITRSPQEDIALVRVEGRKETDEDEKSDNGREQAPLLWIVDKAPYNTVRETLTAKALMDSGGNTLLLAIKIIGRLKERASGSDCPGDFIDLANRVEEFTLRFLDPLKHDSLESVMILKSSEKDFILEKATKFELKKFCEHPVIMDIIDDRWYTPIFHERWTPFIWFIWALFDVILLPITLPLLYVLGLKFHRFEFMYKYCFRIPYIIFLRDTMSSVALVGLHFWICLEPSQLAFSHLEWAILVFLFGRLVLEFTQIAQVARVKDNKMRQLKNYLRDRWNIFDLVILFTYFCAILPLRVVTWASSETETNNRALLVAGYLYGFNMMLLTFRTFGSFLEIFEGVGTIQIALFNIIKDACVIVLHFIVITLGFSSTVTKVLAAGNSMVAKDKEQYSTCNKTGIHCWWEITAQLGLSLLDLSDGLDFFKSADSVSQTLSRLLFAAYLVIALILLINMLIALLSNTYQRVQDNSRKEWAFQKAITVQTYSNFHPIPVPFNIISIPVMVLPCVRKIPRRLRMEKLRWYGDSPSTRAITRLQAKYRLKYGDSFPSTDPQDPLLEGINDTVGVVNQVLYGTDQQGSDSALLVNDGPQAWDSHEDIAVEGVLLSCTLKTDESCEDIIIRGARYHTPFSPESPHFEIMTWEPGESMWLCVGVVFRDHNTEFAPGDKRTASIGFDARTGRIYDADTKYSNGKKATGPVVCHRGDAIRVTVMFGDKLERDGKFQVPVVFTVNGSRIVPEGNEAFIVYSPDKPYIYPYISFRSPTSVQDKMVMKDDLGHQDLQIQEVKSELSETKAELRAVKTGRSEMVMKEDLDHQDLQLQEVKSELTKTKSQLQAVKSELSEVKSKLVQVNQSLERKLDAMLAKLQ